MGGLLRIFPLLKELRYNTSMETFIEALLAHVRQLNEKAVAWIAAVPEGGYRNAPIYTESAIVDRVVHNGVKTPAEWDALIAWEEYYDVYKDVEGISPRWTNWREHTAEEWEKLTAAL